MASLTTPAAFFQGGPHIVRKWSSLCCKPAFALLHCGCARVSKGVLTLLLGVACWLCAAAVSLSWSLLRCAAGGAGARAAHSGPHPGGALPAAGGHAGGGAPLQCGEPNLGHQPHTPCLTGAVGPEVEPRRSPSCLSVGASVFCMLCSLLIFLCPPCTWPGGCSSAPLGDDRLGLTPLPA